MTPIPATRKDAAHYQRNIGNAAAPVKHLRTRESSELGGTRYHGICGSSGLRNTEYAKSTKAVTCAACLVRVLMRERKTK